ncbi:tRNA 2-thiouridine synthesizing protein E [Desulfonatronum thiosulfatophilum]|uniref:tRNA 2-thiouridine synthesizing protein E n=1 Tax=Desulfonatronum thiosulfatophilum TaxID=617002 RepID=A0A1G6D6D7_9BACT|nr:TusE/DsrC/DsvC family sulfur relay protein [Desulfonatronum thiosulfatophilum]SDB40736.1 tRNA 2-thiouridine synthesizing protein E [Desulfonatronum thiosulfatophilum]
MTQLDFGGKSCEVDQDGFLLDPECWNEDVARAILKHHNGPELNEQTLSILQFMREHYKKFNSFPILHAVCKKLNQPKECVREEFLDPLLAWKAAGLPKPENVVSEADDRNHEFYRLISMQ